MRTITIGIALSILFAASCAGVGDCSCGHHPDAASSSATPLAAPLPDAGSGAETGGIATSPGGQQTPAPSPDKTPMKQDGQQAPAPAKTPMKQDGQQTPAPTKTPMK